MMAEDRGLTGIIYPPPEIKAIIDKTAGFVARNGREFEGRIQQHEQDNPKFKFLDKQNPYNAYYEMKITEAKRKMEEAAQQAAAAPAPADTTAEPKPTPVEEPQPTVQNASVANGPSHVPSKPAPGAMQVCIQKPRSIPKIDPCPVAYTIAIPTDITPLDLDVIKLTAQYVARNGQSFLSNITGREHRNSQFDFLKGTHRWFQFFHSLVDAYTKIAIPSPDVIHELQQDVQDRLHIMEKCTGSHEWKKKEEAKRQALEDAEEKERVAFQLIDWHDFVVVETIDFNAEDEEELMPHGPYRPHEELPALPEPPEPAAAPRPLEMVPMDDDDGLGDLDVDIEDVKPIEEEEDDDDDEEEEPAPVPAPVPAPALGTVAVLDGDEEEATVVAEYRRADYKKGAGPVKVLDPHSGQLVDADMMSEHMRIKTLDPKWKEQQEREKEKLATTNLAPDADMSRVLSKFAARRSDIFGDVEGRLGQNVAELVKPRENPLAAARAASAAISAAMPMVPPEPPKPHPPPPPPMAPGNIHIGPPPGQPYNPPPQMMYAQPPRGPMPGMPGMPPGMPPMGSMPPGMPAPPGLPPPMMGGLHGMMGHPMPPPPPGMIPGMPMPPHPPIPQQMPEQPSAKRPRIDPYPVGIPSQGPVTITIILPHVDGSEYDLRGQAVNVTVPGTGTIKEVKEAIQEVTGVPPGKCQLKDVASGAFLKDTQNILPDQRLELAMRERGGKKKA